MRRFVGLISLAALGGVYWLYAKKLFGVAPSFNAGSGVFGCWTASLGAFAIPVVLIVVGFFLKKTALWLELLWGAWMSALSLGVLFTASRNVTLPTREASLFVVGTLLVSLSVVIFTCFSLSSSGKSE